MVRCPSCLGAIIGGGPPQPGSAFVVRRLRLTFTPTHASWLSQIVTWLGILARKVVRRGILKSRYELAVQLMNFIKAYNRELDLLNGAIQGVHWLLD